MKATDLDILLQEGEGVMLEYKGGFSAVFRPLPAVSEQVTPQVGTKLELSRHQVEIMEKCRKERALLELMDVVGRSDRTKFRDQVINPLIEAGLIEMTIPDKPRSSKQRYRTTSAGRSILEKSDKALQP